MVHQLQTPAGIVLLALTTFVLSAQNGHANSSSMLERIESRVAANPNDASAWRMLGKLRRKNGDVPGARHAIESAIQIDPTSTAAHFDLAQLCLTLGEIENAAINFQHVINNAPNSEYAEEARQALQQLDAELTPPGEEFVDMTAVPDFDDSDESVETASYEITRFDNSAIVPDADEILPAEDIENRWRFRLESGVVYNSNVTLTPINRELFPGSQDTTQFFMAPEVEYRVLDSGEWGAGPTFLGHFTFNEDSFSNLNLQSYQPGAFLERVFSGAPTILVSRVQYGFTHDAFDGDTIGNRHSIMASTAAVWNATVPVEPNDARDLTFSYLSVDHTDILDNGTNPSVTSRDGWTYRLGAAHTFGINKRWLRSIRIGADLEHADLSGNDFAYDGVSTYAESELPLTDTLTLKVEGGWGYRDYSDFTGTPSRNENIWRAGTRLTKQITDHWSVAGVFNYDRFDSDNELFNSDRFLTGLVAVFER